jgi:hypothetical protein
MARDKSVTISVLAIEGEDCGISMLSKLAQETSGSLVIVNPLELQRKLRAIIDNPVTATDVSVKIFLPPLLRLPTYNKSQKHLKEKSGGDQDETRVASISVGNVTATSDFAIDFDVSSLALDLKVRCSLILLTWLGNARECARSGSNRVQKNG